MSRDLELIVAISEHFAEIQKMLNELSEIAHNKNVSQPESVVQNSNEGLKGEESNSEEVKEAEKKQDETRGLFSGMNLFGAKDKP